MRADDEIPALEMTDLKKYTPTDSASEFSIRHFKYLPR